MRGAPGIDYRDVRLVELAVVARDNCHAMMGRSGRNDKIWLGECVTGLSTFLDKNPPLEHDLFRDWQNPLIEHRSNDVG